jgi:hypothetical protein
MEEIETDCFRFRNDGRGNSQNECDGWLEGESGKDKGDMTSPVVWSLGRRQSVLDRGPIETSVSILQIVEVSSNGVGQKSGSVFGGKKKEGLKESQREGYLETDRNAGERERVIIITGHHANVGNLKGGSALNGWGSGEAYNARHHQQEWKRRRSRILSERRE